MVNEAYLSCSKMPRSRDITETLPLPPQSIALNNIFIYVTFWVLGSKIAIIYNTPNCVSPKKQYPKDCCCFDS